MRVGGIVDLRPGEGRPILLLFLHACTMGVGNAFLDSAASALFLSHYDVGRLPYVYVASAVSTVLLGFLYTRLEARISPALLLSGTLVLLASSVGVLYIALLAAPAPWLTAALMMWKDVQAILSSMELWAVAGMMFNLRQGKRLFGLVGAGDVLAIVAGGLAVPFVVRMVGTVNLIAVAAAAQVASLVLLGVILRTYASRMGGGSEGDAEGRVGAAPASRRGLRDMLRDRYVALLFTISALSLFGYYFVDYVFYGRLQELYPDADAFASAYGLFLAATGVVTLVSTIFVSGPVLTNFGVRIGLFVLPGVVAFGAGISLIASLGIATGAALTWTIFGTKLFDEVLRKATESPCDRVLNQPLPRHERLRVQALRESVIEPAAMGAAGVLLLVLDWWYDEAFEPLLWWLAAIVVAWLLVAHFLGSRYGTALGAAIARRRLGAGDESLTDAAGLRLVTEYLTTGSAVEIVYALEVLERTGSRDLTERAVALLDHAEPLVREAALGVVERALPAAAIPAVRGRLAAEPDDAIRAAAVRVYCALAEGEAIDDAEEMTADRSPAVRRGALVGLLRYCGIDGVLAAGPRVQALAQSPDPDDRAMACDVLGAAAIESFYRPLLPLLKDEDHRVRRAALRAAGRMKNPRLVAPVMEHLGSSTVADAAANAVVAMGNVAVPALVARMDDGSRRAHERTRAVTLLARIGPGRAADALRARLDVPHAAVRGEVLSALERSPVRLTGAERARVLAVLRAEAEWQARLHGALADLAGAAGGTRLIAGTPGIEVLREAIAAECRASADRMLSGLTLVYPDQSMKDAKAALSSGSVERRAQGLEVVDTTIARTLRPLILPVLDDLPSEERVRRLEMVVPHHEREASYHVRAMATASPAMACAWLRAVAMHVHAEDADAAVIAAAAEDPEPLVRESAGVRVSYRASLGARRAGTPAAP